MEKFVFQALGVANVLSVIFFIVVSVALIKRIRRANKEKQDDDLE